MATPSTPLIEVHHLTKEFGDNVALENLSWETHLIWRPHPLVFGLEYRRIETTYGDVDIGKRTANHVNVAMGFVF